MSQAVMRKAASNRKTRATDLNASSSRSHAILTLELRLPLGARCVRTPKVRLAACDPNL